MLTLASGVAPCPSAIIIMLFALGTGAMALGIAAVLALSLGMGLTVSTIGILSIVARKYLKRIAEAPGRGNGERIERALALAGALAVTGFASLLMLGAWQRL